MPLVLLSSTMLTPATFQQHSAEIIKPETTPDARRSLVAEVRDSFEIVHTQYASFLHNFLPAFKVVLSDLTTPQYQDNVIQKTRAIVLEILSRLQHNNVLRDKILDVYTMAMTVLKTDNENNAVTALRIIFELHKNDRHQLVSQVQPLLEFVKHLYESFGKTVETRLVPVSPTPSAPAKPPTPQIFPSTQSFKVITECPLLVMLHLQLYPNLVPANVQQLRPLMVRALQFTVPAQMIPAPSKQVYHELIASQVKTLSFLAYLLKQYPEKLTGDELSVPRSVVKLMQTCPGEAVGVRKELLVATRHVLGSRFRRGFFDQINLLLDEKILVGTGRTGPGTLRPLGYSFLAELVHYVRLNLTVPQLEKIIFLFSANVHDPNFSYTLQTKSVRLLLNLIGGILKVDHGDANQKPAARELLIRILETLVAKYITLGEQVPKLLDSVVSMRRESDPIAAGKRLSEVPLGDPLKEITDFKTLLQTLTLGLKTVIWSAINVRIASSSTPKPAPSTGTTPNSQQRKAGNPARPSIRTGLLEKECEIVARLLPAGRKCFRLYSRHEKANGAALETKKPQHSAGSNDPRKNMPSVVKDQPPTGLPDLISEYAQAAEPSKIVAAAFNEEKEVFDQFAQIFTVLDPPSFQGVFGLRIPELFEYIVENGAAVTIPQLFLANNSVSKYFADIMFNFLVENMKYLDVPYQDASQKISNEGKRANCLLKLFKILFASVSLFPANEPVLRLHLHSIVKNCLRHAAKAKDPHAYLQMLRALFKSVTNGKHEAQFDLLYRDFMPLVEPIFSHLLGMYAGPSRLLHRELIIELCLMVPARPSTIFPYIEQQIKPIVWALDGGKENPMYGLRTLEFWVDMLQPAYLRLLLANVEPDLSRALHRHLRPPGNPFGPGALRILGKLGSRSRNQIPPLVPFTLKREISSGQRLEVDWQDGMRLNLETDGLIHLASNAILDLRERESVKYTIEYKRQAWKFLFGCLCKLLGFCEDVDKTQQLESERLAEGECPTDPDNMTGESGDPIRSERIDNTISRNKPKIQLVFCLLKALLSSAKVSEMNGANSVVVSVGGKQRNPEMAIETICQFFALQLTRSHGVNNGADVESDVDQPRRRSEEKRGPEIPLCSSVFFDSLVESMSLENRDQATSGLDCLRVYVGQVIALAKEARSRGKGGHERTGSVQKSNDGQKDSSANPQNKVDPGLPRTSDDTHTKAQDGNVSVKEPDAMDVDTSQRSSGAGGDIIGSQKNDGESLSPKSSLFARVLAPLIDKFCHRCHGRTWNSRWAGTHGLNALLTLTPPELLSSTVSRPLVVRCFTALLSVGRVTTDFSNDNTLDLVSALLQKVIRILFKPQDNLAEAGKRDSSSQSIFANNAYKMLALDLSSASANARRTAQACFRTIAARQGRHVCDILLEVKDEILKPLRERPIRQHKVGVQIGYFGAINFCMDLGQQDICNEMFSTPFKEGLLVDSMHIVDASNFDPSQDADDGFRARYHDTKYLDGKTSGELVVLRRAVVDFLCNVSVRCSVVLQDNKHERIFRLMISCFFRSLQSRDEEMVQSAKKGLKHAISKHPKPKDLLQNNLRPVLGNLGDYKKLTLQYLQGLNRVLELFSHWFNVNLGEKLLEHLQHWTEPEKLPPLKKMMAGSESKVAAAILDLFHLLPTAASKFMDQIVHMVLKLEAVIALAAPGAAHLGLKNAMGASTSPYRTPLLKFANHHASVASRYFLSKLDDDRIRQLFFVMVRSTESEPLRKELMQSPKRLLSIAQFSLDDDAGKTLHVVTLIDLLSRHKSEWLKTDADIMSKLSSYWKALLTASDLRQNNSRSLSRVRTVKLLADIFIRYCLQFPEEIDMLFELAPILSIRTICDFTFVKDFLHSSVTQMPLHPNRKGILTRFLSLFQDKSQTQEALARALKYIVTPMVKSHLQSKELEKKRQSSTSNELDSSLENGRNFRKPASSAANPHDIGREEGLADKGSNPSPQPIEKTSADEILDAILIQRIMTEVLDQPDEDLLRQEESLSAELLQFATVLLQYMPKEVGPHKKEIIKFGWDHLKREESVAKQWAFVNVSRFFRAYKAPVKIILQVYVALLRTKPGDCKELVQEALDVLTPALPFRLAHNPTDNKYPLWIRYTKKILLEEAHSVPNLVHIWQLMARHPSLFYFARAPFVPIMVNSLNKIGLHNSPPSIEYRRLALDLVQLIISWEKERRLNKASSSDRQREASESIVNSKKRTREGEVKNPELEAEDLSQKSGRVGGAEPPAKIRKSEDSQAVVVVPTPTHATVTPAPKDADDFTPSQAMVDMIINFLTQVLFRQTDRREAPILMRRCILLLEDALSLWPGATVRLQFVEKLLAPIAQEKSQANVGSGAATKPVINAAGAGEANNADGKNAGKGEPIKDEKMEQARQKHLALRHSALMTTVILVRVFAKHLGQKFVLTNINAIRILVAPAICEGSLQAASQFGFLLEQILQVCSVPLNSPLNAHRSHSSMADVKSNEAKRQVSNGSMTPSKQEMKGPTVTNIQTQAGNDEKNENAWIEKLVAEIAVAIDACLKSSDTTKNHCGMIVLKVFAAAMPREFPRYQESLAKALHRMTKENLSSSQPQAPGGGTVAQGTTGPQRSTLATEKTATLGPNGRGSGASNNTQAQEQGPGTDGVRGTKPALAQKNGQQKSKETRALLLSLSLLGENISTLEPGQRKTLSLVLSALIDRCVQVEVLLEIVRIVETWVYWKPLPRRSNTGTPKEPLAAKDKVHILLKMITFDRISGHGSQELMNSYLTIILRIFGGAGEQDKRPELIPKLERAFMLGLKSIDSPLRKRFFYIYDTSVDRSLTLRLNYVIAKQDWEYLSDAFWIKYAVELVLSAVSKTDHIPIIGSGKKCTVNSVTRQKESDVIKNGPLEFNTLVAEIPPREIIEPLLYLCHFDPEVAHRLWVMVVPKTWQNLTPTEQMSLERSLALLLTKEYHQMQASWRPNNIQSLLEAVGRCDPLPVLRSDVVRHLGSRWNAWHSALDYLEKRERGLLVKATIDEGAVDNRQRNQVLADLEDVYDAQTSLFSALHERDYVAGLWKHRARSRKTTEALCLEQIGLHTHAQETYSEALSEQIARSGAPNTPQQTGMPGRTEVAFWEQRWIECARSLCQWEVLTEFSRTVVNCKLLHECLWRLPDWSALKELLIKSPVEDGPQLKIYQAYVHLQENKLEVADNFITQGYLKAQEKFCSLPQSFDLDACSSILVQFQQLVELQESTRILSELNALSRHGAGGVNVDQKIDNIRLILNAWRERLPSVHEPLPFWNDILTWRNHVHAVVVNVLDALKEAANAKVAAAQVQNSAGAVSRNTGGSAQAAQVQAAAAIATALSQQVLVMGVNETAWNVHRFGKACRKQGYPDVALYVLQKMYPFGTMELTEYFVKTKETARSFMDGPRGLDKHVESGLHELNRCNMDHFNSRQKAQLFTIKGKLYMALGKEDAAVEAFSTALHTSPDVGSAWLVWGQHCDTMQERAVASPSLFSKFSDTEASNKSASTLPQSGSGPFSAELAFREAAVNCYMQAARFGSRKLRSHFPRILRLLSIDLKRRVLHTSERQSGRGASGQSERVQTSPSGTANRSTGGNQRSAERSSPVNARLKAASMYGQGVSRVIRENVHEIPAWMWLPWIPHLVSSLRGREGTVWKPLLVRLAHQYPQALFYPLKSFIEERKLIDKPNTEKHRDAMKLSRPITAALKVSASPAHLTNAARQTQEAKENANRANQRLQALRKELENLEKAIAASEGNPDHSANLTRRVQLKNEITTTQRKVTRCIQVVQAVTQRQRQIKEMLGGNQFPLSETPDSARKLGTQSVVKPEEIQEQKSNRDAGHGIASQGGSQKSNSTVSPSTEGGAVLSTPFQHADFVMTELVKNHQEIHYEMDLMTSEISTRLKPSVEENITALMNNILYQCYNLSIDENKDIINAVRKTLEDVGHKYFGIRPNGQAAPDERLSYRVAKLRKTFQDELAPQTARSFPKDIEGIISRLRHWQRNMHRDRKSQPTSYKMEDVSKYLLQLNDSGVEVFGQYSKNEFSEPSVENHIKIAHFGSDVEVLDGPTGRCLSFQVIGSDGRDYQFVVETGTKGSIQIAEERMSQLYRLLNCWIFGKNCEAQRRRIRLSVPMLMGIGNKVRLISFEPDTCSLASAVDDVIVAQGTSTDNVIGTFRELLVRKQRTQDGADKRSSLARNKKAVYSEICNTHVPDWCLSRMIMSRTSDATTNFMFRKRLGESVGYESLVSYILGIEGRGPERLMICWKYGIMSEGPVRLLTKNMRLGGSGESVPFRLTRNLEKAIGRLGVNGALFGCMASSLDSMREEEKLIGTWMDLMGRDELHEVAKIRMEGARKQAGSSVKFGAREMEIAKERMLDELMSQVKSAVSTRLSGKRFGAGLGSKEKGIELCHLLVSRAQNVDRQLEMETSWQAWI